MPFHPDKHKGGRKRKAQPGDVITFAEWRAVAPKSLWQVDGEDERAPEHWSGHPQVRVLQWAVVTGYEQRKHSGKVGKVGWYQVVRISNPVSGYMYGPAVWKRSDHIMKTKFKYKRGPGTVLANERLGGNKLRGCSCECCAHVEAPLGEVKREWQQELAEQVMYPPITMEEA